MSDFFSSYWTFHIALGTLGGIFWILYLLKANNKLEKLPPGQTPQSTGHEWDGIEELNNPLPFWWVGMFYITIVIGLVYLVLFPGIGTAKGMLGWTSAEEHAKEVAAANEKYSPLYAKYAGTPIEELAMNEDAKRTGARLFANNCAVCHGSDAQGARRFPNLTDNDWLYGGSAEQIKTTIMNGRKGAMPAWKAVIGDEGVHQVTSYVLSLSGREAPAEQVAAGESIFKTNCIACHGVDAKGMHALGAPNLTDNTWLYGASRGHIEETIAKGRNGVMPAQEKKLGEDKVHILAAYVYSLSHP